MITRKVTDNITVAGQIAVADVQVLAGQGFKSIICNRPDFEAAGQPESEQISAAAKANGLEYANVPVISGQMTAADLVAFAKAFNALPKPVLAYCRSGTRSVQLWAMAEAQAGTSPQSIIEAAAQAGYNLSGMFGQ